MRHVAKAAPADNIFLIALAVMELRTAAAIVETNALRMASLPARLNSRVSGLAKYVAAPMRATQMNREGRVMRFAPLSPALTPPALPPLVGGLPFGHKRR